MRTQTPIELEGTLVLSFSYCIRPMQRIIDVGLHGLRGVDPGGLAGRDPQILGKGSWGGREILYLIMYRKYVRK